MKTNVSDNFRDYISAYAQKDLDSVSNMFSEDVRLRDWKISVSGKDKAVEETRKNFSNAKSIDIEILNVIANENSVAGELKIVVDDSEILHVIDVVSYNAVGKIYSIRAYLGRAD